MTKRTFFWVVAVIAVFLLVGNLTPGGNTSKAQQATKQLTFSDLNHMVSDDPQQIKALVFVNGSNEVIVEQNGKPDVTVTVPDQGGKQTLINNAASHNVAMQVKDQSSDSGWQTFLALLINFGPFLILILFFMMMMKGMQGGAGGAVGKIISSGAQQARPDADRKTFADVAGCDEAKQELTEIVDYLREPGLLSFLGGRPPRGVLLVGPPGNGKTLLAKAVAGEANVPFYSISASQFVQMFVGVGAARVRDLFTQATPPCVIFIDELDAVGRQRGSGIGGGHDEREQTLNELLVQIDGFGAKSGIILMAATNRPDVLDPALVRPGRFDRQVLVDQADVNGREAIFRIHMRSKKAAPDVDARELARLTPGFSGAEIEGVCNEAATVAARRIREQIAQMRKDRKSEQEINAATPREITRADFAEGIDRVQMGVARTSRAKSMSRDDMENTSIHELGHALVNTLLKGGDPVTKITIMPRARALGFTQSLPEGDRYNYTRGQLLTRIMMAMGGRAAQEVLLGTVDTGAQNDFKQAYQIAKRMVTEFGMSRLGPIHVSDDSYEPFLGRAMAVGSGTGPELANAIDREIQCIVNGCFEQAKKLIADHKDFMLAANQDLLKSETLLGPEWNALLTKHGIVPSQLDITIDCDGKPACHECGRGDAPEGSEGTR